MHQSHFERRHQLDGAVEQWYLVTEANALDGTEVRRVGPSPATVPRFVGRALAVDPDVAIVWGWMLACMQRVSARVPTRAEFAAAARLLGVAR